MGAFGQQKTAALVLARDPLFGGCNSNIFMYFLLNAQFQLQLSGNLDHAHSSVRPPPTINVNQRQSEPITDWWAEGAWPVQSVERLARPATFAKTRKRKFRPSHPHREEKTKKYWFHI